MGANFVLIKKDGQRRVFPLAAGITIIGRHPNCDLRIPLMEISRRHCQVDCHNGLFSLRDLGSSNGTFLRIRDGRSIPSGTLVLMGQQLFRADFE